MQTGRLIINPMGGLANRMRAMASGLSLARDVSKLLNGGKPYQILPQFVWLKNRELNAEFTDIFRMPDILVDRLEYPSRLKYDFLYNIPRKRNLYITALTCRRFGVSLYDRDKSYRDRFKDNDGEKELLSLIAGSINHGKSCLLRGCTVFYPFDEDFYRSLFHPTEEITTLVEERLNILGKHSVGIHIRRSDNVESISNSPDEMFVAKIKEILSSEANTRFYLASDSETVKTRFKKIFGDHIVTGTKKADRNSVDGIKEAAIELFTLAGTDRIYGSYYSSFSEAAALIGKRPYKAVTIFAPNY